MIIRDLKKKRVFDDVIEYLIDWSSSKRRRFLITWQSEKNIDRTLIEEYEQSHVQTAGNRRDRKELRDSDKDKDRSST